MLSYLIKRQRIIAGTLFWIFYLGMLMPVYAYTSTAGREHYIPVRNSYPKRSDPTAIAGFAQKKSDVLQTTAAMPTASVPGKKALPFTGVVELQEKEIPKPAEQEEGPGPGQPEMEAFKAVGANDMVDLFSGDFSYNIPLLDVGGYPVNLSYNGGRSMDDESSWVGLGWNINPGAINRNVRGVPDDFNGDDQVVKTMSTAPNKTIGGEAGVDLEIAGLEMIKFGMKAGLFYNNYKGWGTELGANIGITSGNSGKSQFTNSLSFSNNSQNGITINNNFSLKLNKENIPANPTITTGYNSRLGVQSLQVSGELTKYGSARIAGRNVNVGTSVDFVPISFSRPSYAPSIQMPYTSRQLTAQLKLGGAVFFVFPSLRNSLYASSQYIKEEDKTQSKKSFGYLYMQQVNGEEDVLFDYNREKDLPLTKNSIVVGMPSYTYDVYSINGQGTGGMFRPYRGDVGYTHDHTMRTNSLSGSWGTEIGFGNFIHAGTDFGAVVSWSRSGMWRNNNNLKGRLPFKYADSTYEPVYFKNPGEKTQVDEAFQNSIGGEELVNAKLGTNLLTKIGLANPSVASSLTVYKNGRPDHVTALNGPLYKKERDKRTQVISYLTAGETEKVGLDKKIRSYPINTFPTASCTSPYQVINRVDNYLRRTHHLGEITVLNGNGGRYVYGIPAYNYYTKDVSFATGTGNNATGLVDYAADIDNSINNQKGVDHFYNSETIQAHAHSFLLTGVLSPDYVDVGNDGITDDDIGDAVKFNYTRIYGGGKGNENPFPWRAPYQEDKASYNPGLKTDNRDDRGTYAYGIKEIWYLNSIESKNMIATFVLDVGNNRKDANGVTDENGGRNTAKKLYRLEKINLYTKADFNKNGSNAKPIKTVHFEYDYTLCVGNPSSVGDTGKLTLKKVWFSYNKNYKGQRNAFQFWYNSNNPSYDNKSTDRWGVYKDPANNPGTGGNKLTNNEFPYTLQSDSATVAANAGAWSLDSIKLPSGGRIKVTYESDEYAFVQDKRATQMMAVAGFGQDAGSTPSSDLYYDKSLDYNTVFITVPQAIVNYSNAAAAKREIHDKYLEGIDILYFKLMVKMPDSDNSYGSGYEMVPGYGKIKDYGVRSGTSGATIWITLEKIKSKKNDDLSPFAVQAIQFLRLNLSYKAHPHSEIGDNVNLADIVLSFATVASNIKQMITGFPTYARSQGWCKQVITENSFVRLCSPKHKKLGGGHRVKRIQIYDNWNNMSSGQQQAVYGQEYDYTTTRKINGVETRISSGVATYEPMVGNDENPLRLPINNAIFNEPAYPLGPTDYNYVEAPVGESFYPGASVGYSKVTVQSIHKTRKSSNGTSVTEFFTARDFPVKTEFTPFEKNKTRIDSKSGILKLWGLSKEMATVTQGFKISLNDMHGRMRSQAVYPQGDMKNPTTQTINFYKLKNDLENERVLSSSVLISDSANGVIRNGTIGRDIELMADFREHESYTASANIQLNADLYFVFIFPVFQTSIFPVARFEQSRYRAVTMTKVVNSYGILDSVVVNDKGSVATTRNMVYDAETGDVLLTRTNNEYNDPIYNFSYPAHWAYSGMGPAYKNIRAVYRNLVAKKGKLYSNGTLFNMARYFESGDEVVVESQDGTVNPAITDPCLEMGMSMTESTYSTKQLWVLNAAKAREGNAGCFLATREGKYYTGNIKSLWVLRSGKRNMQSVSVGSITSLNNPIKTVSSRNRFVFDSATGIIATGAAKFKDIWPVENRLKQIDSCVKVVKYDSVTLFARGSIVQKRMEMWDRGHYSEPAVANLLRPYTMLASYQMNSNGGNRIKNRIVTVRKSRSLLKFDFSQIPSTAIITSARFKFAGMAPRGLWDVNPFADPQLTASYDGLGEVMTGLVTKYPLSWDGVSNTPPWDATNGNVVNIRPKATLAHQNTYGVVDYLNTDATSLIQNLLTAPRDARILELRIKEEEDAPNSSNTEQIKFMGFKNYEKLDPDHLKIVYRDTITECYKKCVSEIDGKDTINPYVYGIWGNWRGDRAYTYYGERKETDPTVNTNIRKNGQIYNFNPYWTFANYNDYLSPSSDETRWVWNSEIKMLNRKGFDIENRDPLNRHNAGIYGYRQHLPVAVAQNSKQREIAYDGFEDYDYNVDTCIKCAQPLWIDHKTLGGTRVTDTMHTGKYSLRLAANQTVTIPVDVVTRATDSLVPNISIGYDTTTFTKTVVTPVGDGLAAQYWETFPVDGTPVTGPVGPVNHDWVVSGPFMDPLLVDNFKVEFKGKIQPKYTGNYTLYLQHDDGAKLFIDDVEQTSTTTPAFLPWVSGGFREDAYPNINMVAGSTYRIKIIYREDDHQSAIKLLWSSSLQQKEIVPDNCLYDAYNNTIPSGTVSTTGSVNCIRPKHPKPENLLTPRFSPINGTTLVIGAWVREGVQCTEKYNNVEIVVTFNDGSSTTKTCKPSGNVIEGWQRIEEVINVPATGTVMNIQLKSLNSTVVYFDDIRVHPFNSNMKSFVYSSVNLRLMADLDENNYASFYEYDDDGTLIRVKKETERGVKTIQETRSALIKD